MVHKINSVSILTSTKNIFKCLFMTVLSGVKFKVKSLKDSQHLFLEFQQPSLLQYLQIIDLNNSFQCKISNFYTLMMTCGRK